jgi:aspartyl-tRNA(Asn)/glutamyl-tRNA(Gln) amidotransferase subunit A
MPDAPASPTARALSVQVRDGAVSAVALLDAALDRIEAADGALGAFCATFSERARDRAQDVDRRRAEGAALGALAGVPIASKDNLLVAGEQLTAGSRMLSTFTAPYTATALQRLEAEDGVLLGRTNMDEFGMGSTTETSAWQRTRNPFGEDLVPGGSSGGSAAAVAADLCALAVGSDTGGSVRQPAALCGVTGFKPSYGRVSRYGLVAYASSLDCVGAIARTAEDLSLWLDCASGQDEADATSRPCPEPTLGGLDQRADLRGLRVGVPRELNGVGVDDEVLELTSAAVDRLRALGAEVVQVSLPHVQHAVAAYYLLATSEAASNLARYDGVHYGLRCGEGTRTQDVRAQAAMTTRTRSSGFGEEVQLRILLGTFATSIGYSSQFYEQARRARRAVARDFSAAFQRCDLLVSPTSPTAAPRFGESAQEPVERYRWDALTVPASLAGLPALSAPCGQTADGRPVGLQLMASVDRDDLALQVGHLYQQDTAHHQVRPAP